jgi:membrane-bound metal-dependent hydrolase YbcI (DUF457 family)
MKWPSHQATAMVTAMAIGFDFMETLCVVLGSVFPDSVEMSIAGRNKYKWRKIHRKFFHWWVTYAVYIIFIATFFQNILIMQLTAYFAVGAYFHIIGDAFTVMGVPFFKPDDRRIAIGLFKTGSKEEYKFTTIYVGTVVLLMATVIGFDYKEFYMDPYHSILGELQRVIKDFLIRFS